MAAAEIRIGTSGYHFDNDGSAYAVENALTLKRMLGKLAARQAA
jgi:hypothetical protein